MEMTQGIGYLTVNVSTANGVIPLPYAGVTVLSDSGSIITVLTTDASGKTDKISLPAPSRTLSEVPGNTKPYATYTLQVEKEGFYTVTNAGVPVFEGVTSIQPVEMLALAEYDSDNIYPRYGMKITETEPSNL